MTAYKAIVRVLVNDWSDDGSFLAEHGLACWLELGAGDLQYRVLFDTGQSGKVLAHNAAALGLNWATLDAVVLSHGHYDHSGGLDTVLRRCGRPVPVILHPEALCPKLKTQPVLRNVGLPIGRDRLEGAACLVPTVEPLTLAPGVQTSGEIPRKTKFEAVRGFHTLRHGRLEADDLLDDQALFIQLPDAGLVIITGCAHAGLINTIQHGMALTGATHLDAVIGGFHLQDAPPDQVAKTLDALQGLAPRRLVPLHCTGQAAMEALGRTFGARVQRGTVGSTVHVQNGYPTAP